MLGGHQQKPYPYVLLSDWVRKGMSLGQQQGGQLQQRGLQKNTI